MPSFMTKLLETKKFFLNIALVIFLSTSLASCAAFQEWFESMLNLQEEQEE